MTTYRFASLPSNSSIAATVTALACAWFLAAAAAIIHETPSAQALIAAPQPAAVASSAQLSPAAVIAPEARFTIVVEARRV